MTAASMQHREADSWSVLTLVLWTGCLAVGVLGLTLSYARPRPAPAPLAPVEAVMLDVALVPSPQPQADLAPPPAPIVPPPPTPEPLALPPVPPLLAVAPPNPAVVLADPVKTPAPPVELEEDRRATPPPAGAQPATTAAAPAEELIHGEGEGRQPAPAYPRQALRDRQEGAVRVRFTVGEQGRVLAAEAIEASAWPLLNQAAVRTVRERWRFPAGALRHYEVIIRFEIKP